MAHGHDTWDMSANLANDQASHGEYLEHYRNTRAEISTVEIRVYVLVMHSATMWYVYHGLGMCRWVWYVVWVCGGEYITYV